MNMKITLRYIHLLGVISFLLFNSCGNGQVSEEEEQGDKALQLVDDKSLPMDQRIKTYVERKIGIPADENYQMEVFEEHLNDDGVKDVIITVNRLEHAIDAMAKTNRTTKAAQIGFFGQYNYFIYYSSKTNSFSEPFITASTPQRKLNITFVNLSSDSHKDILVDYAIRNSQFRRVYLMLDDVPSYAFQWKLYDGWGTPSIESYCFDFGPGYRSKVKDIIINKGDMKNIGPEQNYDVEVPEITCTNELVKRFFFNEADRKYYTPN